jgi:phosphatidylserine decarboxylase
MKQIRYISRKTGKIETENPPGEFFLRFLYQTSIGQIPLNLIVKRKFLSVLYGKLMSLPSSKKKIAPFVKKYSINLQETQKSLNEFETFNDFFSRKLKPKARQIQSGLVSPADGKIVAFENINELNSFFVKGSEFTLKSYLQNAELATEYKHAALFLIRLAPNDYHRFHFPYAGLATPATKIKGHYVSVSPYATSKNFTKVFCENKREYTLLKTLDKGEMLISPVGATMVGTIIETYEPNSQINKGDEMGYFAFGGSSILLLVDRQKIKISSDILANTQKGFETSISMGEQIAE